MTFLEMLNSNDKLSFLKHNKELPSKPIGESATYPAWQFSSVAESKRQVSVLHRYYKKTLPSNEKKKQYVCKVKSCCRVFASYHQLNTHKKKENHFVRKQADGKKEASVARKKKDGMKVKEKIQKFSTQQERMIRW